MRNKKSTIVCRTDLVNIGIGQGQRQAVPYLAGKTDYDQEGRVVCQSHFSADGVLLDKICTFYDEAGRVVRETSYLENEELTEEKNFEFSETGKIIREIKKYGDGSIDITRYQYDEEGLPVQKIVEDDEGEVERREIFQYKDRKLVLHEAIDGDGNRLILDEFDYDTKGNITGHVCDNEETGEYFRLEISYNDAGRKVSEKLYDDEDTLVETTWFEEDDGGRVVQTVEESRRNRRIRNFHFDNSGNSLGYEETDASGNQTVVVEHLYDHENNHLASVVFVNGGQRSGNQHYELKYEYEWFE